LRKALGLIEVVGLAAGIEAADTAVKAANVNLIGYELTRGGGMVVIKLNGDIGAVKAAVEAAAAAVSGMGKVYAAHVIPRPSTGLEKLIISKETIGKKLTPEKQTLQEGTTAKELVHDQDIVFDETSEHDDQEPKAVDDNAIVTCNLCGDPECPRRKGEPKATCIHYNDHNKEEE
jgi:microcompartment protein CcmL/EutN